MAKVEVTCTTDGCTKDSTKKGLCSPCYDKAWKRKNYNPDNNKNTHLKWRYGITLNQYRSQLAWQCGMCAICGSHDGTLVVDHCHATGSNRGLLCHDCNLGLGKFKDNPASLVAAVSYLKGGEFRG